MRSTSKLRLSDRGWALCALLCCLTASCDRFQTPAQRAAAAARDSIARDSVARTVMLAAADTLQSRTPTAEWPLPFTAGGLTVTNDGRLLVADAESGNVSEIDHRNGTVIKTFRVGRQAVHDEFVGITTTGNGDVFEVSRDGAIYHFLEGADGNRVEFLKHTTSVGATCDVGGVAYDKARNSLLLACRDMKRNDDSLAFFWWRLDRQVDRISEFRIANPDGIHPDEVAIDPFTGNYLLFASKSHAVIAMTPKGSILFSVKGPAGMESLRGAAITRGGAMLIAKGGHLVSYRWR